MRVKRKTKDIVIQTPPRITISAQRHPILTTKVPATRATVFLSFRWCRIGNKRGDVTKVIHHLIRIFLKRNRKTFKVITCECASYKPCSSKMSPTLANTIDCPSPYQKICRVSRAIRATLTVAYSLIMKYQSFRATHR